MAITLLIILGYLTTSIIAFGLDMNYSLRRFRLLHSKGIMRMQPVMSVFWAFLGPVTMIVSIIECSRYENMMKLRFNTKFQYEKGETVHKENDILSRGEIIFIHNDGTLNIRYNNQFENPQMWLETEIEPSEVEYNHTNKPLKRKQKK